MNPHIFVYGTLLSTAGHPMGARLHREARLVGPGSIPGILYRVSWYPVAIDSAEPGRLVHGEVYALDNPAHSLEWLDEYESVAPEASGEYARVERQVRLASGEDIRAWVYISERDVSGLAVVPGGRWVP